MTALIVKFTSHQVITDHTGSVNCIAVLPDLLSTGSSDGTVNIYSIDASTTQFTLKQTLRMSPVYPLQLSLYTTENGTFLAIGGSSPHVYLYASPPESINFTRVAILKGHEDWIRGLDFTASDSDIYLATASQDRYVRLWRITQSTPSESRSDTDALSLPFLFRLTVV